ncbi:flagellar hook assembly protein FlgD [Desulfovibrio ferrophilus]|uniref:Basal-body rod modification protein FlgD n=1 Tax=Desulfovibrio ferrophilus TaxID=241368 RepID=A0A2Z6AWN4_9BACT|nr:flagellar hook capping FlgD N-terminal domain-containing protein [Desulfovibrio ferrophilus]BBD07662.1 flagellar hook capping protein [Desulfovibrio ferrophilus]
MSVSITDYLNSTYDSTLADTTASSELDQDAFLELLLTQLQWQDPMDPMDDTEMVAQLAEFSQLSSLEELNENMDTTVDMLANQLYISATSYVGKEVEAYGSSMSKDGDSISTVTYTLAGDASEVTAHIIDENNDIVASVVLGSEEAGSYSFEWDGLDSDGNEADDGSYAIAFTAYDSNDDSVSVSCSVSGLVSSVYVENGTTYLETTDGRIVAASNVSKVVDTSLSADSDSENSDD